MLTAKQMRFVRAYIKNVGKPEKAARLAGYKGSKDLVEQQALKLLENSAVRAEITAQMNAARLDANMILHHIQDIATADIGDFLDINADGTFEWNLQKAKAAMKLGIVKGIKTTKYGIELEFYDKLSALKLLGQHEALFVTVSRNEDWKISAIRDIQNERVQYKDLLDAFGDPALIASLYLEAGVLLPDYAQLPAGADHLVKAEDVVEAEIVEHFDE